MATRFGNGIDLASQRVQNIGDPSTAQDAASKNYVDNIARGLTWKQAARAGSTGNIVITGPGTVIDGVTLAANDRILLMNQTTASQNGLWVFQGSAVALTRPNDYAAASVQPAGSAATITEGTANNDKTFLVASDGSITVDTTATTWAQLGGGGTMYTAGAGLQLAAGAFSVVAGSGILADATSTRVDPAVVVRKFAANIGDGTTTAIVVTHGLATSDVTVSVFDIASGNNEIPDINHTSTGTTTITYAVAPAAGSKRIVIAG